MLDFFAAVDTKQGWSGIGWGIVYECECRLSNGSSVVESGFYMEDLLYLFFKVAMNDERKIWRLSFVWRTNYGKIYPIIANKLFKNFEKFM